MLNAHQLKKDIVFEANLKGRDLTFHSTWGLFSPKAIDEGSVLLLEYVDVAPGADILDIGCGYGALGVALAKSAPQGQTHMVDKDFVAVEYASKNAEVNRLGNAHVYLSNGLSEVPHGQKFDVIVSNIPAKVGKEMLHIIFRDAKKHLKEDGKIYAVTINGLRSYIKREFKEVFGNCKKLKQGAHYTVSMAVKE